MREELTLAIEEIRQRPHDHAWFIPVKITPCRVPEISISASEALLDLQYIDLTLNWDKGMELLVASLA